MNSCMCYHYGSVTLIIGPMFSGKTTELMRMAQRYKLAGRSIVIVKYELDTRYDANNAWTHDKRSMPALSATSLLQVMPELLKHEIIGIDEGHFFKDLVGVAQSLANIGKIVLIAALNGDFRQEPFPNIAYMIPYAEHILKLSAVCKCGRDAYFTFRTTAEPQVELIGGKELYKVLCRFCALSQYRPMLGIPMIVERK